MYGNSSCDGATHVLSTLLLHYGMSHVQYLSTAAAQRATYTYSTAERVICTAAAAVAAVMELRMYCQRWYMRYVLRSLSTANSSCCGLTFLRNYAVSCGLSRHGIRTPTDFVNKQNSSIIVASNYPACCGTCIPTPTPALSRITILHLPAATTDGRPE